jgi:hypothetical protein
MDLSILAEAFKDFLYNTRKNLGIDSTEVVEHIVFQREVIPDNSFKAYKRYKTTLWIIVNKKRIPVLVVQAVARSIEDNKDKVEKEVDRIVLKELFNLISSKEIIKIVNYDYSDYNSSAL